MVQFPVKTYKSFILNTQSERLFQSFLPWVENLSGSPSWYIPAEQMPHRENLSCLPEKKMIEKFVCIASFHCYSSLILLKKTKKQKTTTDWKRQNISSTRLFYLKAGSLLIFLQLQCAPHDHTATDLALNSI